MKFEAIPQEVKIVSPARVCVEMSPEVVAFLLPYIGQADSGNFESIKTEVYALYQNVEKYVRENKLPIYTITGIDAGHNIINLSRKEKVNE